MATKAERITQAQRAVTDAQAAYDVAEIAENKNQDELKVIQRQLDELNAKIRGTAFARLGSSSELRLCFDELNQAKRNLAALIAGTK